MPSGICQGGPQHGRRATACEDVLIVATLPTVPPEGAQGEAAKVYVEHHRYYWQGGVWVYDRKVAHG